MFTAVAHVETSPTPHVAHVPVEELDAGGVLAECGQALLERRAAEVRDLRLVAHWAALHGTDPRKDPTASPFEHLVPVGGDGTPWVRDLCLGELALVRQVGWMTARSAMADVLDLQHRLPQTWARVTSLEAEPWVARKVAVISRPLGLESVGVVDAAVARAIAGESPSRVLEIARAKVIEAEPAAHAARVAAEQAKRYVSISRTDEAGLRFVVARVQAGDAVYVDAMVQRVADILRDRLHAGGLPAKDQPSQDVLRAQALGWLARPAELLQLILEQAAEAEPHAGTESTNPTEQIDQESSRTTSFPTDLLAALRAIDPTRLRPRACLYVHVTAQGLLDPARGVARVEESGPVLAAHLVALLGHSHVTLKPVIDLADEVRVTAYEHPEAVQERVWLINGGDRFPYTSADSRRVDFDHPQPWSRGGPPGQTGTHNSQPLGRRGHRWKTHAGVQVCQLAPGRYVWRTPHGHHFMVDPTGTHPVKTLGDV